VFRPRAILHPTDFSAYSDYAFRIAVDLARQYDATLLVLHVVETLGAENVTFGEAETQLEPESYRQRLRDDLRRACPPPDAGVAVEHLLAEGSPPRQIDQVARERSCGLVVMGTHGPTGLSRLLMGSIAEQVMRHSDCPVLTVKAPAP